MRKKREDEEAVTYLVQFFDVLLLPLLQQLCNLVITLHLSSCSEG